MTRDLGDKQMLPLDPQQDLPRTLDSSFWSLYPLGCWQTSTTLESPFASESQLTSGKVGHETQGSERADKFIAKVMIGETVQPQPLRKDNSAL